jgi:integrase
MENFNLNSVTANIMLDQRRAKNNTNKFPVKYRVNHKGKKKYFPTGKDMTEESWLELPTSAKRNLIKERGDLTRGFRKLTDAITEIFDEGYNFSFEKLEFALGKTKIGSLDDLFIQKNIELMEMDRVGTAVVYQCTFKSLKLFHKDAVLQPKDITISFLKRYQKWMIDKNNTYSTVGIYLRHLRAILNIAKKNSMLTEVDYPFGKDKFQIPSVKVEKRVLTKVKIKCIIDFPLEENTNQQMYRDFWIFSYLGNGMNINDLCRLKYANIFDDEIQFLRKKTILTVKQKKTIYVSLTPELLKIINKWGLKDKSGYIFPILTKNCNAIEEKTLVRNLIRSINNTIENISKKLKFGHINTYTARHSYASNTIKDSDPFFVRDQLGHTSITSTQTYMATATKEERRKQAQKLL